MEIKLKSNLKNKFLVNGSIIYHLADKPHPLRHHTINTDMVFDLIVQEH